ncbi:hypothetical protein GQ53DRAFT_751170 [Thozetella sp. PMI_491]|nr:hypothetical protein GQ53DRAFT_751170 [Thozetella sp. PMI_491]
MYNGLEAPPLGWTRGQALARYLYSNPKYGKERPGFDASVRYIHESMPDVQFKYPVPLFPPEAPVSAVKFNSERLLFTTTERVYVNVRPSDHFKDGITKVYRLRAASGRAVGFVEPSTPDELVRLFNASEPLPGAKPAGSETGANDEPPAEPEVKLELVSLSQGWSLWTANMAELRDKRTAARTSTERYEFHNVLWVQWKDGVASRYGLGRVMADCWASLEPEAVDLVLG